MIILNGLKLSVQPKIINLKEIKFLIFYQDSILLDSPDFLINDKLKDELFAFLSSDTVLESTSLISLMHYDENTVTYFLNIRIKMLQAQIRKEINISKEFNSINSKALDVLSDNFIYRLNEFVGMHSDEFKRNAFQEKFSLEFFFNSKAFTIKSKELLGLYFYNFSTNYYDLKIIDSKNEIEPILFKNFQAALSLDMTETNNNFIL